MLSDDIASVADALRLHLAGGAMPQAARLHMIARAVDALDACTADALALEGAVLRDAVRHDQEALPPNVLSMDAFMRRIKSVPLFEVRRGGGGGDAA